MQRSNPLFLAPIALSLATADTQRQLYAAERTLRDIRTDSQSWPQASSGAQFSDVPPTDWAYQALSNLIDRSGCVTGAPSGRFQGGQG